jgi:lauroyl/myristoyl acyltransferase
VTEKPSLIKRTVIRALHALNTVDYGFYLPFIGRLPLPLAYRLSALRGMANAFIKRDWRSLVMGTRHVARQSTLAYKEIYPDKDMKQIVALVKQRYRAESREEFEAKLICGHRINELSFCCNNAEAFLKQYRESERGLVMLTPHFDSFILGVVFLGQLGLKVNLMSSLAEGAEAWDRAIYKHVVTKYENMEPYLNGGHVVPLEVGMRPFYQMLKRKEILVILCDVPLGGDSKTDLETHFINARRKLSGGAYRMAEKTSSNVAGFVCEYRSGAEYSLTVSDVFDLDSQDAADNTYEFLSENILRAPGKWWASYLLLDLPPVA